MHRFFFFLILILFLPALAKAQGIRGTVIDQDGEPLPFTTIYVQETGSGSVTNQNGKYEIRLGPGKYSISFQFLGYKSEQIAVTIGNEMITRDIVLQQQAYALQTAEVEGGKEDPAYKIMRKAIAKSSYHRQQVNHYTCEVYLKGGGRLVDAPWFLEKMLTKEGLDTSATFVTESISEITYTRPGDYKERVISIRSTGDDQNTSPMNYINSSLYEPEIAGLISPFSPKAFAYYKFKYLNTFSDRGYQINEIQVIPRSRGEDVFTGNIYVVEDLWAIHSVDLYIVVQGIRIDVEQIFAPILPNVWMPVSHKYDGRGKILGFEFEFQYLATVSKYAITLNDDLADTFTVLDEKTEQQAIESRDSKPDMDLEKVSAENKLMKGEELTRKELRQLMREYERQERKQTDEPEVVESREVKIDSTAYENDSTYWALKRPIPLTPREEKGYDLQDSLALEQKKRQEGDTLNTGKEFKIYDLVWGNTYDLGNDNTLKIRNALASIRFNSVDGWNFKYGLNYYKRIDKDRRLEIAPVFRYAFARDRGFGKIKSEFSYGKGLMKGSKINVEGGYYYSQFNDRKPIATFTDAISSLFVENHFMRVYDKKFIETHWEHRVLHNLILKPSVSFAERIETFNNTDYVWIDNPKKEYPDNAPVSLEMPDTHFGRTRAFKVDLGFTWKPWARYYKRGDSYSNANNPPEINVTYQKAIPGVYESTADYDLAKIEIKYRFDLNLFGKVAVRTEAGKFLRNKTMDFMDYAHFMGNQTIFTRFAQMQGYSIAPYYDYSTNDQYVSTWINYEFRQFLLTNIRVLRLTGVKENININHIITPTVNNYVEVGYSIDNIFRFFRVDVTGAFLDGKYEDFRIQLGITTDLISFQ